MAVENEEKKNATFLRFARLKLNFKGILGNEIPNRFFRLGRLQRLI